LMKSFSWAKRDGANEDDKIIDVKIIICFMFFI